MKSLKILLVPLLLIGGLAVGPGAQAAALPPSLAGEVLTGTQGPEGAVGTCNSGIENGTFTYHATGTATGPYPGTFVEDITVGALSRRNLPESAPTMMSFDATFTITSGSTIITGTKELRLNGPGFAWCTGDSQPVFYGFFETTALTYSATIQVDGMTYLDSGTAKARDAEFDGNGAASHRTFTEEFLTSNGVAPQEPPVFTADTPPATATVGSAYSYTFTASGNPAPQFTVSSGALPEGLGLNTTTGVLSGTPTTAGQATFTVTAANGVSPDAVTSPITITVSPAAEPPVFTADTPPARASARAVYTYTFTATGYPAPTFLVSSGALPAGLSLDSSTGVLSGIPTKAGRFTFTVTATNGVSPDAVTPRIAITVTRAPGR